MQLVEKIKTTVYQFISNKLLQERFGKMDYLPRWIIYCIDVAILIFGMLSTHFLITALTLKLYDTIDTFAQYGLVLLVNMIFFVVFKTYSGIIRHSTFIDGAKLLFSTTASFLVLAALNYFSYFSLGKKIFLMPALFINFLMSFTTLFLFRIFIKYVFDSYTAVKSKENLLKVLILGTDANAISIANALKTEVPLRFSVVGFVDKENHNATKRILNLPILNLKKRISTVMRAVNASALIIADKSLTKEQNLVLVEDCLEFNYKVFTVPSISNWEDSNEISNKVVNFQIQDLLERKPIVLDNKLISHQLKDKCILISGAAGSIGSEIVRQIIAFHPDQIVILDQAETPLHQLQLELNQINSGSKIITVLADVRNKTALREIYLQYQPQIVFHAAAYKHVPLMEENPTQAVFANILGTKNIADLACEFKVENFVMVSTDKAVNPSNVMGASKRIAEKYVQSLHNRSNGANQSHKTKFITTRFGNVLGSNGSVVPLFTEQIAKGGPITITHPEIIRYFMTIPEACQLVLEAGAMGNGGEIFIFDMGKPVKIIDLANKMIRLAGLTPEKDIKIKIVGLRPGEKLYEELLNDTSKTLPTYHEKIMIAEERVEDQEQLSDAVDQLIEIAKAYNNQEIVGMMKTIVPEYISMNSTFSKLDN